MSRVPRRAVAAALPIVLAATLLNAPGTSAAPEAAAAAAGVSYGYDAAGRLTSVTDPAGASRTFAYDAVGNLTRITAGSAAAARADTAAVSSTDEQRITNLAATYRSGSITLTGTGLPRTSTASVKVGGLFATVTSTSPGRLVVAVPPGLSGGRHTVRVAAPSGALATTSVRLPGAAPTPPPPAPSLAWLKAPAGVTAIAGRIRDSHTAAGLGGVEVVVDGHRTTTRNDGRFLLTHLPAGHHELEIDASALPHAGNHGAYEVGVDAIAGKTVAMPWTTWLTAVDMRHAVHLPKNPPHAITVTSPSMPGLSVHVPAHTRLTDGDGHQVRWLSLTKMPLRRQPFPGAPGMTLAWTIQPGDVTVSGSGLRVVYPNLAHQPAGTKIDYVDHDADRLGNGWSVYGHGRVTANGASITPNRQTRLHKTYQLGVSYNPLCTYLGLFCPHPGDKDSDGDPVDLQTGLFVFSRSDLVLPDVVPIALTRTYRQNDNVVRSFGIGQSDAFNSFVSPDGRGNYVVQMADGSSVPFTPTSDSTVYTATPTPTALTGATMATDNHRNFTVTLPSGRMLTFGGETASLVSVADRFGNATTLDRDGTGRLTRVTSPNGRWISITWGACTTNAQCITGAKDNLGRTVAYGYDTSGRMISVTDPAGKKTTYTWAACNDATTCTELLSITDPLGAKFVANSYDANGRVDSQRSADGATYTFAYDLADDGHVNAATVTDPRGLQRQIIYDADGYSASDTAAYGTSTAQTVSFIRDSAHRVVSSTDQLDRTTTTSYDDDGNVLSVTALAATSSATTTTFTYEPVYQRIASVTDPLGHRTTFAYDDDAQSVSSTDPSGRVTSAILSEGQPVSNTDAMGNTSYVSYLDGEPVTSTDATGNASHSYFDPGGRLTSVTDPLGDRTTFTYDLMNDQLSTTDPLGHITRSTYDADGQLLTSTDPLGHATTYTYDAPGRLTSRTDALGKAARYTYDADGNVATATDRSGSQNVYTYDSLNRPKFTGYQVTGSGASRTYQSTVTSTFDTGNRLTRVVDTTGGTTTRSYDLFDRVTKETTPQGGTAYLYDAAGRRTAMTVTGQPRTTYAYDNSNELTGVTSGVGRATLTYDAAGRPLTKSLPGGSKQSWTYDDASRITGITYTRGSTTLGTLTYRYDAAGRRTQVGGTYARTGLPATVASSTYNADNGLTRRGSSTFGYDPNGQLTTDGATTYTWNARHELTASNGGPTNSSYTYDAYGRRLTRTVGSATTGFVYDGENVVQERAGGAASANLLTGLGVDQTFARNDGSATSGLLTDAQGSTVALTGATGSVSTSYTYDPFGVVTATGTGNSNPLQYTGRENDGTGLNYNRARYYSPTLERFISQDPAGAAGSGNNLYSYVSDTPTNGTDPSGQFGLVGCAVGAGISVLGGFLIHKLSGQKYTFGEGLTDAAVGCVFGAIDNIGGIAENLEREGAEAAESAASTAIRDAAESCANSFTADTPVTMADGTQKPIKDVKVGDTVLATDPATGKTAVEPVVKLIRHHGVHRMVRVGLSDGSTLVATNGHPVWDATTGRFTDAGDLRVGDQVESSGGRLITIGAITGYSADLTAYNLQIGTIHTYYAGSTPVLVHNSCGSDAFDYATSQAKLDHVFADKHNFDPLVQQFGSREAVVQQFLDALSGLTPAAGTFEQTVVVGGQNVVVRGFVDNGVVKIGTAFTPP